MDYNRIALFVRVVRSGSFTAAASAIGLPKSSVSRNVSQLERDLGVRLLQRTTRKLALTTVGEAFFESVAGSVAAIDEADASAREHGAEPRGVVRMSAPPDFGTISTAVARFIRKHPAIRVELGISSRYVDLVGEGFDLAIRAGKLDDSSLVVKRIGTTEMTLFASSAYLRRRGRPKSVDELVEHDWVLYRANTSGRTVIRLTGPEGERSIEVTGLVLADDMNYCRNATEAGVGIALLPVHVAASAIDKGQLEQVLPEWRHGGAPLSVVLPTSRQVPARVALLRDFLVSDIGASLAATQARCDAHRKKR